MNDNNIDWAEIERRYIALRVGLDPIRLPSDEELRAYKLARSRKLKKSSGLPLAFAWGERSFAGSERRVKAIQTFNNDLSTGGEQLIGKSETKFRIPNSQSCFTVIDEAIATRTVSTDFVFAWGFLNSLIGRQRELLEQEEDASYIDERGFSSGSSQAARLRRYWYARWMIEQSSKEGPERENAQSEIAQLCADIWRRQRPAVGEFDRAWFEKLICQEVDEKLEKNPTKRLKASKVPAEGPCKPIHLRSSYRRLGWGRLVQIANDRELSPSIIPPTSLAAFPSR
jgi:hypothetical protein